MTDELPSVPEATRAALVSQGLIALADELATLRAEGSPRQPFVWRSLASATDVDVVRLRPPREEGRSRQAWCLAYAVALGARVDTALPQGFVSVPRELLGRLLQPIVAGLLVDEGRARDLGEAEPVVLAPSAATLVDPRIDAVLEERPLLATRGALVCGVRAVRGPAGLAPGVATLLGLDAGAGPESAGPSRERPVEEIVLHLPLGEEAIEECRALLAACSITDGVETRVARV